MDIISLPIEFDDKMIDGRFRLVAIAAQRARELALGAKPKVQSKAKKVTTIAIEEAIKGKLEFLIGEEARRSQEEARKFDYRSLLEERRREESPEDLSELEKDLKIYLHERETEEKEKPDSLFSEGVEE